MAPKILTLLLRTNESIADNMLSLINEAHFTTDADSVIVALKVRDSETLNVPQRTTTFSLVQPSAPLLFGHLTMHVFGQLGITRGCPICANHD